MVSKIYALIGPISNETKYIGLTNLDINKRAYHHWRDRKQKKNKDNKKAEWLISLEETYHLKPNVRLIEEIISFDRKYLLERENYWIDYFRKQGINLLNTSGKNYEIVYGKKN